jgi:hypothetical protein
MSRTITIWNIPAQRTLESLVQSFSSFGTIESTKHPETNDASPWNMSLVYHDKQSARKAASSFHEGLLVYLASTTNPAAKVNQRPLPTDSSEVIEIEEDDCFEATDVHSFEDYRPVPTVGGFDHPGHLVQSASLSSVDPPPVTYKLSLPDCVSSGLYYSVSTALL